MQLYAQALPPALTRLIPEHGSRRVQAAIATELAMRSPDEPAGRIAARWQAWRYRVEDIDDPTAVAITIVRRGYDCADLRCEDHIRLDTGQPCHACADIANATPATTAVQLADGRWTKCRRCNSAAQGPHASREVHP
ncbi:hypothetical protein J5X84_41355 [Streptosporangiaceae bacterium NEAU-GS5]|nr:hypothetical protein [Streptosporangiaceae bacterium NEAU-GS5]